MRPWPRFSSSHAAEFGRALRVAGDDFLEPQFRRRSAGAVEDAADGPGDFGTLVQAWHMRLGVLLEVELAALPGHGTKDGLACGGHAAVVVADDELDAAQATLHQALEKGAPKVLNYHHVGKEIIRLLKEINKTAETPLEWSNNALRHSYISYRTSTVQDVAKVALEAGNSPAMIFKNYRELVADEAAVAWFNVKPAAPAAKIVALGNGS